MRGLALALCLVPALAHADGLTLAVPDDDDGGHLRLDAEIAGATAVEIRRTPATDGPLSAAVGDQWEVRKTVTGEGRFELVDDVEPSAHGWLYAVRAVSIDATGAVTPRGGWIVAGPENPVADWFDGRRSFLAVSLLVTIALLAFYDRRARRSPKAVFIRKIPGIDAMEEAIGRSTEMGRPVLYVPGIDEMQNIQTIASLLVLGHVAELTARYDTELKVPVMYPLVMVVAEEIVRQGYANAGRPDAHRPQNIQFITSEQFAFAAAVNGMMLREKPATHILLGRFFGESLLMAETGHLNGAIQIAGTAELTQLPFFIAACDYTLLGEELYAASAYLSREPRLLSMLKATDALKVGVLLLVLVGAAAATFFDVDFLGRWIP
jgi:hypothetical protein